MQPYPLTFEPMLKEKVWGGRRLERYGKALPEGVTIGESWEIADLDETSATGGGGGSAHSVIDAGPMQGKTIRDAIKRWGVELLGQRGLIAGRAFGVRGDPAFPLLVKYLDASEHLSVQTHPSPAYAERHDDAKLKTETWYVLDAARTTRADGVETDPSLFIGLNPGLNAERLRDRASSGAIVTDLGAAPAHPGDCWTLPSGTLHALGAGVLVAEIQTPSDTTFRVYDWQREYDRPDRELHLAEAAQCVDYSASVHDTPKGSGVGRVADTSYYTIDRVEPGAGAALPEGCCVVVMAIEGEGELTGAGDPVPLPRGRTALVPAVCAGAVTLRGDDSFAALVVRIGVG
ncbi:MAG: mannose-6-phosphate isomerase [Phycisphaerae bacterium]|nr:mannose-6-phosphate isomerase [Phycisphaerae bacterium]